MCLKYQGSNTSLISLVGCFCLVGPPLRWHHLFFQVFNVSLGYPCRPEHLYVIHLPQFTSSPRCPSSSSLLCPGAAAALLVFFCLLFVSRIHPTLYSMAQKTFHGQPLVFFFGLFPFLSQLSHIPLIWLPPHARIFPISAYICMIIPSLHACFPLFWLSSSYSCFNTQLSHYPSLWIEFLPPGSSHYSLFLALASMYFTLYQHSLFLSFLPIKLHAPWGQELTTFFFFF